jgi:hypothetical protein
MGAESCFFLHLFESCLMNSCHTPTTGDDDSKQTWAHVHNGWYSATSAHETSWQWIEIKQNPTSWRRHHQAACSITEWCYRWCENNQQLWLLCLSGWW